MVGEGRGAYKKAETHPWGHVSAFQVEESMQTPKMRPCGCVFGVRRRRREEELAKIRNMPLWACFCFLSGREHADTKNMFTWMHFLCLQEQGKGSW